MKRKPPSSQAGGTENQEKPKNNSGKLSKIRENAKEEGEEKLGQLAVALNQIAAEIPKDIDWILQVEGHTDDIPVRAGRFADNWDLSTERALSVVRFLVESGLPANRLAAAGYGEFQPLDDAGSDEARRRNRRIEMKLTQRITGN